MNLWAGLVVNRYNLPCVGQPLDLIPEYAHLFLEDDEQAEPPKPKAAVAPDNFVGQLGGIQQRTITHSVGDRAGSWELLEYRAGGVDPHTKARYRPHWYCKCHCGCGGVERWVRSEDLISGKSTRCTRGPRIGSRKN